MDGDSGYRPSPRTVLAKEDGDRVEGQIGAHPQYLLLLNLHKTCDSQLLWVPAFYGPMKAQQIRVGVWMQELLRSG